MEDGGKCPPLEDTTEDPFDFEARGDSVREGANCPKGQQMDDYNRCCPPEYLGYEYGNYVCCRKETRMEDSGKCPPLEDTTEDPFDFEARGDSVREGANCPKGQQMDDYNRCCPSEYLGY